MYGIAIHGGAGVVLKRFSPDQLGKYETSLGQIIDSGFDILRQGGSSLDAVTEAVAMLEDSPLFNAGKGAALTRDGAAELDAAIMDGSQERAGAVACVRHIKNPVRLARLVMQNSEHVLLVGSGAEEFALDRGIPLVGNNYFKTEYRMRQLEMAQSGTYEGDLAAGSRGTVGAVAVDAAGNLAAATSTGGMTNQLPGRVGDSPIIGAGTFAKNGVCAVSATGHGEMFMRAVAAHRIAMLAETGGMTLRNAVATLLHETMAKFGGLGGIIAISPSGDIVTDFNTEGMFRAARSENGTRFVAIAR